MQVVAYVSGQGRRVSKPTYTDEYRASCVVMLEAAGYPDTLGALERVARATGAPARTLSRWYNGESNPPPDRIVTGIKRDLAGMLQEAAELHAARLTDADVADGTSARDSAVVMGIAIDKLRLLQELSTEATSALREFQAAAALAGVDGLDMLRRLTARLNQQADAGVNALASGDAPAER